MNNYYLKLLEKKKKFTQQDKQCINKLLKENEQLKDLVRRQVCQAECYRYKQYQQLTQKLEKARVALIKCADGFDDDPCVIIAQRALKELE